MNSKNANDIEEKIVTKLKDTINALEIGQDRKIAKFYIGKAYVLQKQTKTGFMDFDPLNPDTWRKDDISISWNVHKKEHHGGDGMVVLCAITSDTVPLKATDQETFTLDMKERILHRYRNDPRLKSTKARSGKRASHHAYAIYMTFAYADKDKKKDTKTKKPTKQ